VFGVVSSDPRELKIDRDEVCTGDGLQDVQELGWKVMSIHIHRDKRCVFQLLKWCWNVQEKHQGDIYIYIESFKIAWDQGSIIDVCVWGGWSSTMDRLNGKHALGWLDKDVAEKMIESKDCLISGNYDLFADIGMPVEMHYILLALVRQSRSRWTTRMFVSTPITKQNNAFGSLQMNSTSEVLWDFW
jgi:hypothetical protein